MSFEGALIFHIPYDSPSSVHFQIGIGAPKWHLFDWQFCVGVLQTFCKQWPKGPGKIPKFWPLHSVRQNIPGFRRGLFACFLGHTPLLQYYLLFGPHPHITITYREPMTALLIAIWISSENSGIQQGVPEWLVAQKAQDLEHWFFIIVIWGVAQKSDNTLIKGCGPKSR